MTTYRPFVNNEIVELINRTEIENGFFMEGGTVGIVLDKTFPDYYLVLFEGYGSYWVDGCKMKRKHN